MNSTPLAVVAEAIAAGRLRTMALLDDAAKRGSEAVELVLLSGPEDADPESVVATYAHRMEREGHLVIHLSGRRGGSLEASLRAQLTIALERLTGRGPSAAQVPTDAATQDGEAFEEERQARELRFNDTLALGAEVCAMRSPLLIVHDLARVGADGRALLDRWLACRHAQWFGGGPGIRGLVLGVDEGPTEHADGTPPWAESPGARRIEVGRLTRPELEAALTNRALIDHLLAITEGRAGTLVDRLAPGDSRVEGALPARWRSVLEAMAATGDGWSHEVLADAVGPDELEPFLDSGWLRVWHEGQRRYAALSAGARVRIVGRMEDPHQALLTAAELHREREPRRASLLQWDADPAPESVAALADGLRRSGAHGEALALCLAGAGHDGESACRALDERALELAVVCGRLGGVLSVARRVLARDGTSVRYIELAARAVARAGHLREARDRLRDWHTRVLEPAERDRLVAEQAELSLMLGELDEAEWLTTQALERAGAHRGARPLLLNVLGKVHLSRGDYEEAQRCFRQSLRAAQDEGVLHIELAAVNNLLVTAMSMRPDADAEELSRTFGETLAPSRGWGLAEANLAVRAHLANTYSEALRRYRRAIEALRILGDPNLVLPTLTNLGFLLVDLGCLDRARDLVDHAFPLFGDAGPLVRSAHLVLRGLVLDDERGAAELDEALRIVEPIGGANLCNTLLVRVRRAIDRGDLDAAAEGLARATPRTPWHRNTAALQAARLARATGRSALRSADRAVELTGGEVHLKALEARILRAEVRADHGDQEGARVDTERACHLESALEAKVPEELRPSWARRPLRVRLRELVRRTGTRVRPERGAQAPRGGIVGGSPQIAQLWEQVERVGRSTIPVLIRGESGSGKDLVARAIHQESPRSAHPFLALNCAAITDTLFSAELFGHERGAFTGASARREGHFVTARGGTLFLDEVGDLSARTQAALLRVLQEGEVLPIGATRPVEVDVRIVAATHQDLEARIREGMFREDLYYRLRGVELRVPPLRERLSDLPDLVDHILAQIAEETGRPPPRLHPDVLPALRSYEWPGNVRQLQSVLRESCLFATEEVLRLESFPAPLGAEALSGPEPESEDTLAERAYQRLRRGELSLRDLKRDLERDCIRLALLEADGNISHAARLVGAKRARMSQLVNQLGLKP